MFCVVPLSHGHFDRRTFCKYSVYAPFWGCLLPYISYVSCCATTLVLNDKCIICIFRVVTRLESCLTTVDFEICVVKRDELRQVETRIF